MNCPDCNAAPGVAHLNGCDVARCTIDGFQRITCPHGNKDVGWGQIWRGQVVRPSQQKPTPIIECDQCFALIYQTRVNEHAYWHQLQGLPDPFRSMFSHAKEQGLSPDGW